MWGEGGGDQITACRSVQEPESWGAHLNRSAQPTPPPRLTSQERDSLKASAQYFGLKLKSNLALLTKVQCIIITYTRTHQRDSLYENENTCLKKTGLFTRGLLAPLYVEFVIFILLRILHITQLWISGVNAGSPPFT